MATCAPSTCRAASRPVCTVTVSRSPPNACANASPCLPASPLPAGDAMVREDHATAAPRRPASRRPPWGRRAVRAQRGQDRLARPSAGRPRPPASRPGRPRPGAPRGGAIPARRRRARVACSGVYRALTRWLGPAGPSGSRSGPRPPARTRPSPGRARARSRSASTRSPTRGRARSAPGTRAPTSVTPPAVTSSSTAPGHSRRTAATTASRQRITSAG